MLGALFFLFGFSIIAWVPRFPEIKHNLHVSNGEFGTLLSVSAIGSLAALLTVGQLVHRYGARVLMLTSATVLFGSIATIVHLSSTWQFALCNMAFGAGVSAFHISINSQGLHEQAPNGEKLIPRLHGLWSLGALSTAILSGFLAGRVSLVLHIDILCAVAFVIVVVIINRLGSSLITASEKVDYQYLVRALFTSFKVDWVMSLGMICAVMLEFASGDWSTLFANQELHMSAGISAIPYVIFVLGMIFGRLLVHRVVEHIGISTLIRTLTVVGGASFIASVAVGRALSASHHVVALLAFGIGSLLGGLGASFLAPLFMDAANRRSSAPGSVVIGQLGALNTALAFLCKGIIAWTAQLTSIGVALAIPSAMLMAVAFTAKAFKEGDSA